MSYVTSKSMLYVTREFKLAFTGTTFITQHIYLVLSDIVEVTEHLQYNIITADFTVLLLYAWILKYQV
jgi:hypothetical protein